MAEILTLTNDPTEAIDLLNYHTHGTGQIGGVINTNGLADASVSTAKIVDNSVTTAKLADASVTTAKLSTDLATAINSAGSGGVPGLTGYVADGLRVASVNALNAVISTGRASIAETIQKVTSATTVALDAREVSLIYAGYNSTGIPTIAKVNAVSPTTFIDNNTVGMWIFNKTTGGAVIPNSAVGVSSLAVANNLNPSGGVASVDGWNDYSLKLDGSSGDFYSDNATNIPIGAALREFSVQYTVYNVAVLQCIMGMGTSGYAINLYHDASGVLTVLAGSTAYSTSFTVSAGQTYVFTLQYDGANVTVLVNGTQIYKVAVVLATVASVFYVGRLSHTASQYSYGVFHWCEVRNKVRAQATIGAMANSLMLPCFYTKSSAVVPTVPSAYASTYHEYLFNETSGTSVADSNTTSALTGTATNTTVGTSDIGLTASRVFSSASSYVNLGSFACASTFSYVGVVYLTSYANTPILWSNQTSVSVGCTIYINSSGFICFQVAGTVVTLGTTALGLNVPIFIGLAINGTSASFYQNTPYKSLQASITSPNTTSGVAYLGLYPTSGANYIQGKLLYTMFVNAELSQADIDYYYTQLMVTGRRSIIDDVLPTNSVALAFARTNSTNVIEYNDTDYGYGRREKAVGGNRKVFLGWKYFSGTTTLTWDNPFKTRKIKAYYTWAQDANGTNESDISPEFASGTTYGVRNIDTSVNRLSVLVGASGACNSNGAWQTSGYIGCYAEVLEDYKGV